MRLITTSIILLILFGFAHDGLPQQIIGKVIDDRDEPLTKIKIRIAHIASGETDSDGEFLFNLPKSKGPGKQIEFVLIDNDSLAIFEPIRGIWNVPAEALDQIVKIKLLSKGDHRFLNPGEMRALMNDMIREEAKKKPEITGPGN